MATAKKATPPRATGRPGRGGGLADTTNIIAVSSCKGGVGKSTVAMNLALGLSQMRLRVGLLDADIYGPSVPLMIGGVDRKVVRDDRQRVIPVDYGGVRCMSYGFLSPHRETASVMRGPLVAKMIQQMALGTAWGKLDYIVVDMPPGTGDIQLSLLQTIAFSANVVVSTPQQMSYVDVVKGIDMFRQLSVETIGAVNNMAYFDCGQCDHRHFPFGNAVRRRLQELHGIPLVLDLPMQERIAAGGDEGAPFMLGTDSSTSQSRAGMARFAAEIDDRVNVLRQQRLAPMRVTFDANHIIVDVGGIVTKLPPLNVRRQCRCALCVDEMTGIARITNAPHDVHPVGIEPVGNYGISVCWSDGHDSSVYSFNQLMTMLSQQHMTESQKTASILL